MITDTLSNNPVIGIVSTGGTSTIHWLGIVNPILSMFSLLIGIVVGLTTLYLQIKKIKEHRWI